MLPESITKKNSGSLISSSLDKLKCFKIEILFSKWYQEQPKPAKAALLSGLIIGFITHLFIYTGLYFGNHYPGMHFRMYTARQTGRWFNSVINVISYGYIMPLVVGIFVTLFLSLSAFYICKIFSISKKISAILIGALLTTFPSIAFTNLFLYDSANYHLGVFLAVFAVYVTLRYKFGFLIGAILLMFTLAIYQSKFNIALVLFVICLISQTLKDNFSLKKVRNLVLRFLSMLFLGSIFYTISLLVSSRRNNMTFGGHRGFCPESIRDRLLSFSGFTSELSRTYQEFVNSFQGSIYIVVDPLLYAYLIVAGLAAIQLFYMVIKHNIHKQPMRLFFVLVLFALIPFTSNFAGFLAVNTYGPMIYPFVLILVSFVIFFDRYEGVSIIRSFLIVCLFFISANYVIMNNAFYLRAFFFNQRLASLSTRIADRIDPLLPLIESYPRQYTYFGTLPNEYLSRQMPLFDEHGVTNDGPLWHNSFVILYTDRWWQRSVFAGNLQALHGVNISSLPDGLERDEIHDEVLASNMPIWPAEGSVAVINDVIVINFGIADVMFNEYNSYFQARHWVSEGHAGHDYEYDWRIYQNGDYFKSMTTSVPTLFLDTAIGENSYTANVTIRNSTIGYNWQIATITIPAN